MTGEESSRLERAALTRCQTFRRNPPVRLTRPSPGHGAEQVHQVLHVAGCDSGHHRPGALLCRDLRPVEFLGLLRAVRASADLPQPDPLDILVHGGPHRVRGGAQPEQTGRTVTPGVSRAGLSESWPSHRS